MAIKNRYSFQYTLTEIESGLLSLRIINQPECITFPNISRRPLFQFNGWTVYSINNPEIRAHTKEIFIKGDDGSCSACVQISSSSVTRDIKKVLNEFARYVEVDLLKTH